MRASSESDRAGDDPDDVLCKRTASEDDALAGGDVKGAGNLENPSWTEKVVRFRDYGRKKL
jgi:hypothetical protein